MMGVFLQSSPCCVVCPTPPLHCIYILCILLLLCLLEMVYFDGTSMGHRRYPWGVVRTRVLRESPSGSVWHVDPPPLTFSLGMCSLVCAAAAINLSHCFHYWQLGESHESLTNWTMRSDWVEISQVLALKHFDL